MVFEWINHNDHLTNGANKSEYDKVILSQGYHFAIDYETVKDFEEPWAHYQTHVLLQV